MGFSPFYGLHLKGLKPTEEPAKPEQSSPSAEADGKREAEGGFGDADIDSYTYIYKRRYWPSQEKAQLSKKGLSGRASSGG